MNLHSNALVDGLLKSVVGSIAIIAANETVALVVSALL